MCGACSQAMLCSKGSGSAARWGAFNAGSNTQQAAIATLLLSPCLETGVPCYALLHGSVDCVSILGCVADGADALLAAARPLPPWELCSSSLCVTS